MERVIPYHNSYQLGCTVDVTKFPQECGKRFIPEDVDPVYAQPNFTTAQFSFVESMNDVCDVLGITPEYALKVQANLIKNPVVLECLKDIYEQNVVTVIFRVNFLQQKVYIQYDATPGTGSNPGNTEGKGDEKVQGQEDDAIDHPLADQKEEECTGQWVSALEVGNELIAILKISSPDRELFDKFSVSLQEKLQSSRGILSSVCFSALSDFATSTDKKLKKKHYENVSCRIQYGCYTDEKYPGTVTGMVESLKQFLDKSVGWAELFKFGGAVIKENEYMMLMDGADVEKKGIFQTISHFFHNNDDCESKATAKERVACSDVDNDHDSFVVLATETDNMYKLRVTLQSGQSEDTEVESFTSFALSQYPKTARERFEKLFKILLQVEKATVILQRLFQSKQFMCQERVEEGNRILHSIQSIHIEVHEAIQKLDMITMPSEDFVESICSADPLQTVNNYIENVMSKLPPGCDLDLLIIGKTGHGKSSTGNTILSQKKFEASASGESVTKSSSTAWSNVDGRIIKVVDTPGVCDTAEEKDTIDQAILAISEAISQCQGGFHALLLVIRFGQRMTMEEKKAIGMLKCILGETVIQSHCICVVTYGDIFEDEVNNKTFLDWCHEQGGFLKDLFQECQYRCVLFNNKTKDSKVAKRQLIQLITMVDSLKSSGTRYTNTLFEFAQREREKIIAEEQLPPVSQEMMRDIELVLDHLKRVANNTEQKEKYSLELENLRGMVENLSNRVTEVKGDQVKLLVDTVFSLAEVIHGEIDKIADKDTPDPPENASGTNVEDDQGATGGNYTVSSAAVSSELQEQAKNLEDFREHNLTQQASDVNKKVAQGVATEIKKHGQECFPANSQVMLRNGRIKMMEDLDVGEEVLVRNAKGVLCFDTVYMFGHGDPDSTAEYVVLQVDDQHVAVSNNHLVFCVRDGSEMCLPAKEIRIEDELFISSPGLLVCSRPVVGTSREQKRGLFAPFTMSGTIVVDGAVMSCYVGVLPHATAHALLSPMRQIYRFSPSALALVNGARRNKEIAAWAKTLLKWLS